MSTEDENRKRITGYKDHVSLFPLWDGIKAGTTPDWDPGKALEYLVLRAFDLEDAFVKWPFTVPVGEVVKTAEKLPLEQIDGFIHSPDGLARLRGFGG